MKYSRFGVADAPLLHDLHTRDTKDRINLVEMLVDLGEVEVRRLYAPAGYASLYDYCTGEMNWSEDMAGMRLRVARAGRRFHALLDAIADGSIHLTGAFLIAKHMTPKNHAALIEAATKKSRAAIKKYLAARYPTADVPALIRVIPTGPAPVAELWKSNETVGCSAVESISPGPVRVISSEPVASQEIGIDFQAPEPAPSRVTPLSGTTQAVQFTMRDPISDKLQRFGALASHTVRPGDLAALFEYALELGIAALEKRKFAATEKPRISSAPKTKSRTIPANVKREVHERDAGRCTFVSDSGHRCEETHLLEYDHIVPVAKGGTSTASNVRLLCRAHNQLEAERTFGAGFMDEKRRRSQAAAAARALAEVTAAVDAANAAHTSKGRSGTILSSTDDADASLAHEEIHEESGRADIRSASGIASFEPGSYTGLP